MDNELPSNSTSTYFGDSPDVDTRSCRLLGPIALVRFYAIPPWRSAHITAQIVQGLLGILVILSLVLKRQREKPMRPWRIWLFDVSKQVIGQMFVHGVNVLISDLVSHHTSNNACVSYFLNILIDTTLGVGLLYVILQVYTFIMTEKLQMQGFQSGVYGNPPSFKFWLRQATLYVSALTTMKFLVIGLLALFPGLFTLGAWLLSWTWKADGDALQVIFTMGIFPILMNIIQFWLIDSIVKASGVALDLDTPDPLDREPLFGAPDDDDDRDGTPNSYTHRDTESHPHHHDVSSPSSSVSDSSETLGTPAETKSAAPGDDHAYPPSSSSSPSSSYSSQPPLREAKKLGKPKRRPPPPIHIQNMNRPAVNSPWQTPKPAPSPAPAPAPVPAVVPAAQDNSWSDSWAEEDDWADKVGEEEWTGKRMEERKGALSAWGSSSPLVNTIRVA
ncbi:unnamed protein product [Mycena citricolor]|uniref:Vacuolar membrane protein n=1 Tax=Mycena citricolor TaxID=2018698 RepID=A0AAD2JUI4_9AGAR|nr:unnamed protein product [Mycena citricolor]